MLNRCPHFNEGILPILNIKNVFLMLTTSMLWAIIFLIFLPRTSLAVATKYETAYACEGKTLTIECEPGDLISLIRANYGRFSITICNDHGNVDWSVNCMSPKSLIVLNSKCAHKENCSVLASTNMFGDPCPGTHKYLEAHYQCISATQTITTTRPLPSWLLTRNPSTNNNNNLWSTTSTTLSSIQNVTSSSSSSTSLDDNNNNNNQLQLNESSMIQGNKNKLPKSSSTAVNLDINSRSNTNSDTEIHLAGRPPSIPSDIITTDIDNNNNKIYKPFNLDDKQNKNIINPNHEITIQTSTIKSVTNILNNHQNQQSTILNNNNNNNNNDRIFGDDNSKIINNLNNGSKINGLSTTYLVNNKIDINVGNNDNISDYYCGPTTSRNLFWNITRVGEVNVQPCPGGATGIAKWRCILIPKYLNQINNNNNNNNLQQQQNYVVQNILSDQKQQQDINIIDSIKINCDKITGNNNNNKNCDKYMDKTFNGNLIPVWYPQTPDLTQCRSLWLNNLEISVNQRDSSLISIANDLSQVTSSKTLYGGDMLVTTKIIQTMSEKMSYDIETFPDQRQREAIIKELLLSVVKTSSNLLDESQHLSWLDLSFEDQMRVATSLLTGLEHNAFLLADSTIREKDVLQSVKNILLSVRVVETRNIAGYEIFPDSKRGEHWSISDDRIELPRGALIENRQQDELVRIVFVAFDRLESILKPSYDNLDIKMSKIASDNNTNVVHRARILNSKVISASLGKGRHIQLSQPIKLILRHLKSENVSNPTCVYWNYIDHAWSTDGCFLETTNHTHSICMCNHLTNFAILMDVIDEHQVSLLSMFDNKLRIFIYISIAICILFIIIAILTLKLFNAAFIKSTRTSIYKNIYVCLFIIEILFLLGVEQNETSLLCGFTTAFLHCFILSAIAWLFFEGFQLYVTLTIDDMVLELENSSKIIWYYLLSYGLSFTIVAISLAIDPGTYTQSDFCVLMESNGLFYTTFMAPIVLFMIGAIGYTILAGYTMLKKNKSPIKNKEHSRLANVRFDLRCSFVFLMILSADWIFAYIYLRKAQKDDQLSFTYGYLFVTFNSLLGIYIFIFHCIQNEKIRREYRKYIRQKSWLPKCLRCAKTPSISSSSAVSQHHHHHQQQQQHLQQQQLHYNTTGASGYKKSPISNNIDQINDIGDITIVGGSSNVGGVGIGILSASNDDDNSGGVCLNGDNIISSSSSSAGDKNNSSSHIILERSSTVASGSVSGVGGCNSTLRTPSCGHTSPTSSVGSTHLIFNPKQQHSEQQKQNWNYLQSLSQQQQQQQQQQHPEYYSTNQLDNKNLNTYDDKFIQYDSKSKRLKNHPNNLLTSTTPRNLLGICSGGGGGSSSSSTGQPSHIQQYQHEYFYWTEKNNHKKNKLNGDIKYIKKNNNNDDGGGGSSSGTGSSSHHKYYPSYKKTTTIMRHYQQQHKHDNDKLSDSEYPLNIEKDINKKYYHHHQQQQQQNPSYRYNATKYQQQQQQIDDDNCSGSVGGPIDTISTNQHLITTNCLSGDSSNSCGGNTGSIPSLSHQNDCFQSTSSSSTVPLSYHQHYKNNKHSNCDLTNDMILNCDDCTDIIGDSYYNHHHQHQQRHHQHQSISGGNDGGVISNIDEPVYEEILNSTISEGCNDDIDGHNYDDDDDDDEDNELNCILDNEQYNKIRRMISNKEDRQTFYRHDIAESLGIGKNLDINNTLGQQIATDPSMKKSCNKKKHHQQQQQKNHQKPVIVPSTNLATSTPQAICLDDKNSGLHHIVGRNISAMLDENNTVVCYLEPLPK